jgi:hypothetical protein
MKHNFLFFYALLLITITSCKKQAADQIIVPPAGDYFPMSIGSFWNYYPAWYHAHNTGLSFTTGGKTYSKFAYEGAMLSYGGTAAILDTCFYRKENGKYYQVISTDFLPSPLDTTRYYEFVFMEDNAPVGTVWNTTSVKGRYTFGNGSMQLHYSYIGKIAEYWPVFKVPDIFGGPADSLSFNDVTRIDMKITQRGYDDNGKIFFSNDEYYSKWYARNTGLIQIQNESGNIISILNFRVF